MSDASTPTTRVEPPTREAVLGVLGSVIDPELGADIVTLGMVSGVEVADDGVVTVGIKLTIGGCPLRAEIKREVETRVGLHPGVTDVTITWGEMTSEERSEVMLKARWNARQLAPDTEVPLSCRVLAIASGKGGVGKSSVTVNLAAAIAARGFTVGVLDADIWGFSVPRLLGIGDRMEAERVEGSDRPKIIPNERTVGDGRLKVVSTGFLVEEDTALMWRGLMLTKAVEQFLRDVHWGELDYLLIDMPPGTGDVQMGLARMLPRTDLVIVTTPALAAQKVAQRAADMARRSFLQVVGVIENMSAFTCEHGTSYALFGSGGGAALAEAIGAPLLGQVPLEADVAAGGDAGAPVAIDGDGAAARALREIAGRLVDELVPAATPDGPDMAGCSARMLEAVAAALGPKPTT
ncbi:MAG: Mrp/NBP35 family ATP-binding protein [Ilumatobacteraceae bacterium]|jgi:ATP-binding protein involved in chromosome partitioning|nr:Mrp/NBP35 family ATP-binding protein [Ilumatobacteraceae bacterium]